MIRRIFAQYYTCTVKSQGENPNPRFVLMLFTRTFSKKSNEQSFTVSYLINTCGLSPQTALSASKKVSFKSIGKPDSVIGFLKLQGFSETHISKLVTRWPRVLLASPEKTLLPKIEFFISKGFSRPYVVEFISACPFIMHRSLGNVIVPSFEYVKDLLGSNEKAVVALRRCMWIMIRNLDDGVVPNVSVLRSNGVPESNVAYLLYFTPRLLMVRPERFEGLVREVKEMGFDPARALFVLAIYVKSMRKSTWERKVDAYRKWGWSEDVILEAFRKQPLCMKIAEKNIMESMDFFVNRLGMDSLTIAKRPGLILLSLKKTIIPRAAVAEFLLLKGSIRREFSYVSLFSLTEREFLNKYLIPHDDAPQLLKLYNEKRNISK